MPTLVQTDGDPWADMPDHPQSIEPLLEMSRRDFANGLLDFSPLGMRYAGFQLLDLVLQCALYAGQPFDLFEHGFKSGTVAYNLLESALIRTVITTPEPFESSHREPPGAHAHFLIELNSPELPEHSPAGLHRRMAWPGTPRGAARGPRRIATW